MDNDKLGLSPNMFNVNSPLVQRENTTGFQFVTENERGAVTRAFMGSASIGNAQMGTAVIGTANIGTLSFNQISGGTGVFGGTNSGSGVVSVLNQAGSEVVRIDGTGILVKNGSITIQDLSGSNVIDSTGLVSTTNFVFGGTSSLVSWYGTSSTYVPVTGGSLVFSTSRTTNILFTAVVQSRIINPNTQSAYDSADVMPRVNGTNMGGTGAPSMNLLDKADTSYFGIFSSRVFTMSRQSIVSVGSGSGTLVLNAQTSAGGASGTLQILGFDMNYVVLGK